MKSESNKLAVRGELALIAMVIMNSAGVLLMLHSGSGISAISSVPYGFQQVFPQLTLGTYRLADKPIPEHRERWIPHRGSNSTSSSSFTNLIIGIFFYLLSNFAIFFTLKVKPNSKNTISKLSIHYPSLLI